jgi:type III secretory pathway component EscT
MVGASLPFFAFHETGFIMQARRDITKLSMSEDALFAGVSRFYFLVARIL